MLLLNKEEFYISFSPHAMVYPETVTVTYGTALEWEQTLPSSVTEAMYFYSTYKSGALPGASQSIFMSQHQCCGSHHLYSFMVWRTYQCMEKMKYVNVQSLSKHRNKQTGQIFKLPAGRDYTHGSGFSSGLHPCVPGTCPESSK